MNKSVIERAIERIEEAADIGDPEEIRNEIAVIRMQLADIKRLKPEDYFAVKFEAGGKYMVFVAANALEPVVLECVEDTGYDLTFVFVFPDGQPVADKFLVVDGDKKVFANARFVNEMEGITLVETSGKPLAEVLIGK